MDYMDMCDKMMRENAVLAAHRRFVAEVEKAIKVFNEGERYWRDAYERPALLNTYPSLVARQNKAIDAALTRLKKEVG